MASSPYYHPLKKPKKKIINPPTPMSINYQSKRHVALRSMTYQFFSAVVDHKSIKIVVHVMHYIHIFKKQTIHFCFIIISKKKRNQHDFLSYSSSIVHIVYYIKKINAFKGVYICIRKIIFFKRKHQYQSN